MGKQEEFVRERAKRNALKNALLLTLAVTGLVLMGVRLPPKIFTFGFWRDDARFRYRTRTTLSRLVRQGLVTFVEDGDKRYARLTKRGEAYIVFEKAKLELQKKRKWDKRWRMVIFDVPERRKQMRNRLRRDMVELGFLRLQDSVWVHPYDCEDLMALVKTRCGVGAHALYVIAETIEHDRSLREHFRLPMT